jgi:hypothetical protein
MVPATTREIVDDGARAAINVQRRQIHTEKQRQARRRFDAIENEAVQNAQSFLDSLPGPSSRPEDRLNATVPAVRDVTASTGTVVTTTANTGNRGVTAKVTTTSAQQAAATAMTPRSNGVGVPQASSTPVRVTSSTAGGAPGRPSKDAGQIPPRKADKVRKQLVPTKKSDKEAPAGKGAGRGKEPAKKGPGRPPTHRAAMLQAACHLLKEINDRDDTEDDEDTEDEAESFTYGCVQEAATYTDEYEEAVAWEEALEEDDPGQQALNL